MNIWSSVDQILLRPTCLLCGGPAQGLVSLCAGCRRDLPRFDHTCPRCANPLPVPTTCPACLARPPPFTRTLAASPYTDPVSALIGRFKFGGDLPAGAVLAALLIRRARDDSEPRPECLLPVPLHPRRLRQRGFNQSLEIARALGDGLALPVAASAARRMVDTLPQSELPTAARRRRNVRSAFRIGIHAALPDHVALVDDVMTTGATVSELARCLLRAGVTRVDLWVVARAGAGSVKRPGSPPTARSSR